MTTEAKQFHLGDILSITTGRLVAPTGMAGIYDILNYMTDDELFTHQLPRVAEECKPALLAQHPQLAEIEDPDFGSLPNPITVLTWLVEMQVKYGDSLPVQKLDPMDHTHIHPLEELGMMGKSPDQVIVVVLDPEV